MFLSFAAVMPTLLVFPLEMAVFLKERTNGWYSCLTYYLAKNLADLPFQLFFTLLYLLITYLMTAQSTEGWRMSLFFGICILVGFVCQGIGLLVSAIFVDNVSTAIIVAPISCLPLVLLSGFFVKLQTISSILLPITYINYLRYSFEAMIIVIYGMGRCDDSRATSPNDSEPGNVCGIFYQLYNYFSDLKLDPEETEEYKIMAEEWLEHKNKSIDELERLMNRFHSLNLTNSEFLKAGKEYEDQSLIMREFRLQDDQLEFNIFMLFVIMITLRVITFLVYLVRANVKKWKWKLEMQLKALDAMQKKTILLFYTILSTLFLPPLSLSLYLVIFFSKSLSMVLVIFLKEATRAKKYLIHVKL